MLLKKEGYPEEDELVLCTVTAVQFHSVFVKLDEYGKSGLIHISEIAPGRIRNIRDYVVEGKKVVCKVLRVNKEKGHIDLSLRRVNEAQKRKKLNQIKQEQLSEKIVEFVAKQSKMDWTKLYNQLAEKLLEKYPTMFEAFESVATDKLDLSKVIDAKLAKQFTEVIKQRIKPPEVEIGGEILMSSHAPEGIELIKEALKKAVVKDGPVIKYKGTGTYSIWVKSEDYKTAEKILKHAIDNIQKFAKKNKIDFEFKRIEKE